MGSLTSHNLISLNGLLQGWLFAERSSSVPGLAAPLLCGDPWRDGSVNTRTDGVTNQHLTAVETIASTHSCLNCTAWVWPMSQYIVVVNRFQSVYLHSAHLLKRSKRERETGKVRHEKGEGRMESVFQTRIWLTYNTTSSMFETEQV
jgi:hypothetical protein